MTHDCTNTDTDRHRTDRPLQSGEMMMIMMMMMMMMVMMVIMVIMVQF